MFRNVGGSAEPGLMRADKLQVLSRDFLVGLTILLENLALCVEIFANFILFDETLPHRELCNSIISQKREIRQKNSNSVYHFRQCCGPATQLRILKDKLEVKGVRKKTKIHN